MLVFNSGISSVSSWSPTPASHPKQPSKAAIDKGQKNIQKLQKMVGQLANLFKEIDKSSID
jgi:uncharacterized FlaG/YvyC family protein